ncbi:MAG: chromosome segregation protein SMC, partial [Verrucomicrobiota bacterium]
MRLKSLCLQGFKSFADHTEFEFHPGVTAIVGPNGCGKSNVVDAIRWVLGETSAKALRGGEMADVIFNGTDRRKPVGVAEVTLTFGDCEESLQVEFNEVAVTRRVFRDGKSEYRINDRLCRLKDINELFMGTGVGRAAYSIMEQGKIDMLLSSKPEDRRMVFEEAAGITKSKVQKREALRKLDYTEANLLRVADIIEEVKKQKGSLQRQANKARRYQDLLTYVHTLDLHHHHRQYSLLEGEREELSNSMRSLEIEATEAEGEIEKLTGQLAGKGGELEALETSYQAFLEEKIKAQNELNRAEERRRLNDERLEELGRMIDRNEKDSTENLDRLNAEKGALAAAEESLTQLKSRLESAEGELKTAEEEARGARQDRETLQSELRGLRAKLESTQEERSALEAKYARMVTEFEADLERHERLESEKAAFVSELEGAEGRRKELSQALEREKESFEENQVSLGKLDEACQKAQEERLDLQGKLEVLYRRMTEVKSRLGLLLQWVDQGEGLEAGTQSVLKGLDDPETFKNSVRGVLGSMLRVREDRFMPAVEVALREHLQTILLATGDVAEAAVRRLGDKQLGYASLLGQDSFINEEVLALPEEPMGAIGRVLDMIEADERIRPFLRSVLKNVFAVQDLSQARRMHALNPDLAFATLDGEFVSRDGVMFGGRSQQEEESVLRRQNEIRDLEEEARSLKKKQEDLETEFRRKQQEGQNLELEREELKEQLREVALKKSRSEDQLRLVQTEIERFGNQIQAKETEAHSLFQRRQESEQHLALTREQQNHFDQNTDGLQSELADKEQLLAGLERKEKDLGNRVGELRTRLAVEKKSVEGLQAQRNPINNRLGELEQLNQRYRREVESYRQRTKELATDNEQLDNSNDGLRARATELQDKLALSGTEKEALVSEVKEIQGNLERLKGKREKGISQKGREEVKVTRLELRLENIVASMNERYQVEIASFRPDLHALITAIESERSRPKRGRRKEKAKAAVAEEEAPEDSEGAAEEATVLEEGESLTETETSPEEEAASIGEVLDASLEAAGDAEEKADQKNREESGDEESSGNESMDGASEEELDQSNPLDEAEPDWEFVEATVMELRRKLDSMGPVNLDAIGEFEELEERLQFLEGQHDDLVNSKEELLQVIEKINKETDAIEEKSKDNNE